MINFQCLKWLGLTIVFIFSHIHFIQSQCPTICDGDQVLIVDVDDSSILPDCSMGSDQLAGDFQAGACVDGTMPDPFNCFAYVFQRGPNSNTLSVGGNLGQGQGCQGDIDAVYLQYTDPTTSSLTCMNFGVSGSRLDLPIVFPDDMDISGWLVLEITVFVCANSNANLSLCDACANDPADDCVFNISCPPNTELGTFDCDNPPESLLNEAIPALYDITINDMCGTILATTTDTPSPDGCSESNIMRTITVFDDVGDGAGGGPNGMFDADEASTVCQFNYTLNSPSIQDCNDNNPCTENDQETVCGASICIPCAGTAIDVCDLTITQSCDDGDDCTENDMETISDCDGSICIPCAGTAIDVCDLTTTQNCDDGDVCTENDMETISDCDGSICIPCAGTAIDVCDLTTTQSCNDGDDCTENDMETIDSCTGAVCVQCAGTPVPACTFEDTPSACDDGDPCTVNDMETLDSCTGEVCMPCTGSPISTTCNAKIRNDCDDGDPCTTDDVELTDSCTGDICVPCIGEPIMPDPFSITCPADEVLDYQNCILSDPYTSVSDFVNVGLGEISDECRDLDDLDIMHSDYLVPLTNNCSGVDPTTRTVIRTYLIYDDFGFSAECEQMITYNNLVCDASSFSPGTIGYDVSVGPFCYIEPICPVIPSSGACGPLEYMWLQSSVPLPNTTDNTYWTIVPDATEPCFTPPPTDQTMYYVLCVRNFACCTFVETNYITVTIDESLQCDDCDDYNIYLLSPTDDYMPMSADLKLTSGHIHAENRIHTLSEIKYHSTDYIQLNSGFEVKLGTDFEAFITDCIID